MSSVSYEPVSYELWHNFPHPVKVEFGLETNFESVKVCLQQASAAVVNIHTQKRHRRYTIIPFRQSDACHDAWKCIPDQLQTVNDNGDQW